MRLTLEQIFDTAKNQNQMLSPDQAMLKLVSFLQLAQKSKYEPLYPDPQHDKLVEFFKSQEFKKANSLKSRL